MCRLTAAAFSLLSASPVSSVDLCDEDDCSLVAAEAGCESECNDSVADRDVSRGWVFSAVGALMVSVDDDVASSLSLFNSGPSSLGLQLLGERMSSGHEELCVRCGNSGGVGGVLLEGVGIVEDRQGKELGWVELWRR